METLYTNGTSQRLKKLELNNTITIPSGMRINCQKCFIELVRPCKGTQDLYNTLNNSIDVNRCIIFPHSPNFFCRECWNETIQPKIYEVIINSQER
jgi:hypothetical protein